jgi:ribosomal-protein-serine acetyltransferase
MFNRTAAPGIEMRQFRMEDAEPTFALVNRHRAYLREWLPWVDHTYSSADVREFITRATDQWEANQGPQTAIWMDGSICGSFGCHPIDWPNHNTSIGYWIVPELQGKGIVTRCAVSMLQYLFEDLGLHRVEIRCGTGNTRSCAIPKRLGFQREGVAREAERVGDRWVDLVIWSMLAKEWMRPIPSR